MASRAHARQDACAASSPYSGATARDSHPLPYSPRLCRRGTRTLLDKKSKKNSRPKLIGGADVITRGSEKSKGTGSNSPYNFVASPFAFYLFTFSF
jgi:hypothetical protein